MKAKIGPNSQIWSRHAGNRVRTNHKSASTIVVVDDLATNRDALRELLSREGYVVHTAADGREALQVVREIKPDLILMDVTMPVMSGVEACHQLKNDRETRLIPVVLITGVTEGEDKIGAIEAGADDFLTKPLNVCELSARVRSLMRIKRFTDDLESAESLILSLALTIEARDACTDGHCQRLARYATALGLHLGLDDEDLAALYRGGFLHDVGKVGVPDAVLLKRGQLNAAEFTQMKRHTIIGDRLCRGLRSLQHVRPIIRSHHERLDGSGYPDRLAGADIPLLAQIISIVDVFDALTNVRPYKPAFSADEAYAELRHETQKGWRRKDLVEEFVQIDRTGRMQGLIGEVATAVPMHDTLVVALGG